jgi:hypothetical protein
MVVFFCALILYYINLPPHVEVDCIPAPYAAWSLVRTGSFDLSIYSKLDSLRNGAVIGNNSGQWLSKYPPGSTLIALPIVLPIAIFREEPLRSDYMRRVGKLTAAVSVAAALTLFYLLCLELVPVGAKLATILLGAGTCIWPVASQALWTHGPATLWITLALYLFLKPSTLTLPRSGLAGLALGMAMITRPTTVLFAVASFLVLAWKEGWRPALAFAAGTAPLLLFFLGFNIWYFDAPFAGGYGNEAGRWGHPFWSGFAGLLVNPSRGLLVYTPAFLLLPFGVRALLTGITRNQNERSKAMLLAWLAAAFATILLYSHWHVWWGGWCFGPRFLIETFPILCLLFAYAITRFQSARGRTLVHSLIAISVLIHFIGVFGHDRGAWHTRHPDGLGFTLHDTQIEASARHLVAKLLGD